MLGWQPKRKVTAQDQPQRLYDTAAANYYVVAGDGTVQMAGRDMALAAGVYVASTR
jgi:hypothetical protein